MILMIQESFNVLDELGHPGFASTDVELIPESYELKAMKTCRKIFIKNADSQQNQTILIELHVDVRFCSNEGLQAKSGVELHTANWIPMRQEVTIPIREIVLPHLCKHVILISTILKKEPK